MTFLKSYTIPQSSSPLPCKPPEKRHPPTQTIGAHHPPSIHAFRRRPAGGEQSGQRPGGEEHLHLPGGLLFGSNASNGQFCSEGARELPCSTGSGVSPSPRLGAVAVSRPHRAGDRHRSSSGETASTARWRRGSRSRRRRQAVRPSTDIGGSTVHRGSEENPKPPDAPNSPWSSI